MKKKTGRATMRMKGNRMKRRTGRRQWEEGLAL